MPLKPGPITQISAAVPTGVPFGLQVTAPHFHDYRLLELGRDFEAGFAWPRSATGYEELDDSLGI